MRWNPQLEELVSERGREAGFDLVRFAPVESSSVSAKLDAERFTAWVNEGRAGEMEYLKRRDKEGILLRSGIEIAIPWARSVVICAFNYNVAAPRSIDVSAAGAGWIARYAWSGRDTEGAADRAELEPSDYHDELLSRLQTIESALAERVACQTRCYVDTGPLVERNVAARAGIGWVGKNTCIINQELGSWLLLGVIVTSLELDSEAVAEVAADRCGSCTRCIDACPTQALTAPRQMDASRCIAYLTIEKKGEIPEELREPMGRNVFGCDICQDVCPWNRRAPVEARHGMLLRPELVNPALEWLAELDEPGFKQWFKGSPLERTRRRRLHRNVAIAMGNSRDSRYLPQLDRWSVGEDPVLVEASRWAAEKIRTAQANQEADLSVA